MIFGLELGQDSVAASTNAATAERQRIVDAFVAELESAISAYGYTPVTESTYTPPSMGYIGFTLYSMSIAEFPSYPGRAINIDMARNRGADEVAEQMLSDAGVVSHSPATGSAPSPGGSGSQATLSLNFNNITTGNRSTLRVGDSWTLVVTGPPNSEVLAIGGPGGRTDQTVMGHTDSSGIWSTSGRVSSSEIGNWSQEYLVGGKSAGSVNFAVVAAPTQQSTSGTQDKTVVDKVVDEAEKQVAEEGGILDSIPGWAWVAGGAGVLFLLMRSNK